MFLKEYVYEKKHGRKHKKGLLIGGVTPDGVVCIGFSSCSPKDFFDREFANEIAIDRAYKYCVRYPKKIPFAIQNSLDKFINRCSRYFKSNKFPSWVNNWKGREEKISIAINS